MGVELYKNDGEIPGYFTNLNEDDKTTLIRIFSTLDGFQKAFEVEVPEPVCAVSKSFAGATLTFPREYFGFLFVSKTIKNFIRDKENGYRSSYATYKTTRDNIISEMRAVDAYQAELISQKFGR